MNEASAGPAPPRSRRETAALAAVLLFWAAAMFPLLFWGLPTARNDGLLFGGEPAWPAARYHVERDLEQRRARNAGADTDLNPLAGREQIVDLTADDAERAEILRRYRLFSRQPDEMITLMALQSMKPRQLDFDPKLYQYGGGYIYLVGAALGAAGTLGIVPLKSDIGYYLEHPDAFGRFYVVARCISLVFGALTLLAVYRLGRRAGGPDPYCVVAGWLALAMVAGTPVFITAVCEAKPHLPSACMLLWATLAALDFRNSGARRDAVRMGLFGGYAFGLVLTGLVATLLWPAACLARPRADRVSALRRLGLGLAVAAAVYVVTNPYVPYDALFRRGAVQSNLSNSLAMYANQVSRAGVGLLRVLELLVESCGPVLPVVGLVGFLWGARAQSRRGQGGWWICAVTGLGMLAIAILLGAGKPAEFARFLILPVVLLAVGAAALVVRLFTVGQRFGLRVVAVIGAAAAFGLMGTPAYVRAFVTDMRGVHETRLEAARFLQENAGVEQAFGVIQEPAPYAVPPVDFAHRKVVLLPSAQPTGLDLGTLPAWLVFTADDADIHARDWWQAYYTRVESFAQAGRPARIAWANKPVFVCRRR